MRFPMLSTLPSKNREQRDYDELDKLCPMKLNALCLYELRSKKVNLRITRSQYFMTHFIIHVRTLEYRDVRYQVPTLL